MAGDLDRRQGFNYADPIADGLTIEP